MKKVLLFSGWFVCLLTTVVGCSKKDAAVEPPALAKGTVTPKGKPVGDAVTKSIGAAGGTLSSADGVLTLTVPAAAVNAPTVFSIQPIENHLPNGIGKAYRLLPEGVTFAKPVTLAFKYHDSAISGGAADLLWTAYQHEGGLWKAQRKTEIDPTARRATIATTHLSDWALFESMKLKVERSVLEPAQSTKLRVTGVNLLGSIDHPESDVEEVLNVEKIGNWKLTGGGTLQPSVSEALYTAPGMAPTPNPVTVSVEVTNIETKNGTKAKVILFASITVLDTYMEVKSGSATDYLPLVDVSVGGGMTVITGSNATGTSVTVAVNLTSAGTKAFDVEPLRATQVLSALNGQPYVSFYEECNPPKTVTTAGAVSISKFGNVGDYVEGSFNGTLAFGQGPCDNPGFKPIQGRFRVKRRF